MAYRKLNTMTSTDTYPLHLKDDCIDSIGEVQQFTTLDLYSGYWHINICKQDSHKAEFVFHAGNFQFVRMPFGLTDAHAVYQRSLDLILTKLNWKTYLLFLDDIIIYSKDVNNHIKHVDQILTTLSEADITLKTKNC